MSSEPRPKRHHYVPRFYLQNFVDTNGRVWTYDNATGGVFASLPSETALETNLYSVEDEDGALRDDIEHLLSGIESKAAALYPRVLRGETLTGQDKADFAVFLSTLYTRSPAMMNAYAEMSGYFAQQLMDLALSDRRVFETSMDKYDRAKGKTTSAEERDRFFEFARDKSRYTLDVDKKRGLGALAISDRLTEMFFDMSWFVFESPDQHIITSDNPLVRVNPEDSVSPIYGDGGFMNKRSQVTLPLSPTRVLGLCWDLDPRPGVHPIPKVQGRVFNRQRAHFSERYLYASLRDGGISALGQKHREPGQRMWMSGMEEMAKVNLRRGLRK